jgi:hypothetical protein
VLALLASLPRSSLLNIQKKIVPLLQLDLVGVSIFSKHQSLYSLTDPPQLLPTEVALHILSYLPSKTLLRCALVSRRWRTLADDYTLWKRLCFTKGWHWKNPRSRPHLEPSTSHLAQHDTDDEGMGDEEIETTRSVLTVDDSGFESFIADDYWEDQSLAAPSPQGSLARSRSFMGPARSTSAHNQIGVSKLAPPSTSPVTPTPVAQSVQHQHLNYKLLHLTHTRLRHRFLSGSYRLSTLQSRGSPASHTNTIYCLQLYTYPESGIQTLFTGSKDRTIKEWDLATGAVLRTIGGVHEGSVLSICVYGDYLASAGSDSNVVVWDLVGNKVVKVIDDHEDSVLCVRFDDARLVSCSKGELLMEVLLPRLTPHHKTVPSEPTSSRPLIHSTL